MVQDCVFAGVWSFSSELGERTGITLIRQFRSSEKEPFLFFLLFSRNFEPKLQMRVRPRFFLKTPIRLTRVQPCLFSELQTCQTRVRPIPFSELRTCRTRVRPVPFSELRTCQTRVRSDPFSELQTRTPNQGSHRFFLRTPNPNSHLRVKTQFWTNWYF